MSAKVAVIGGGVIGLCSAYYLMKSGHRVTVFESGDRMDQSGCSFMNCGYLTPSHFVPLASPGALYKGLKWMFKPKSPLYIKPRLNGELLRWLWLFGKSSTQSHVDRSVELLLALHLESKKLYHQMNKHGEFGLEDRGLLIVSKTSKGQKQEMEIGKVGNELGLECRSISREEVHVMEPDMKPDVVGGVYFPEDGHVNPEKLMSFLLEALETGGTQVCFGSKVQEIDPQKSSLLVSGEERVRKFDKFVLAAGSWSPSIASRLGLTIPMQAGKGYSMDVMNPPAMLRRPLVLGERKVAITPFRNSIRFGGTMEISGIHQKVNRTRVRAIQEAAEAYLPVVNQSWFSKVKIEQGLRPVSPDGLPYIGVHPLFPSIIIATGHSMMGVSLGPITGQLVAELADEKPLSLPIEKMKPDRF